MYLAALLLKHLLLPMAAVSRPSSKAVTVKKSGRLPPTRVKVIGFNLTVTVHSGLFYNKTMAALGGRCWWVGGRPGWT
jgi:hypothetical protein